MANTIQIKRRTSGAAGSPATLAVAELAYNEVDNVLYIGRSNNTIATAGGLGAFLALTGTQTAAGNYTFNTGTVTLDGTVAGTGISAYVLSKRLNEFTAPNANVGFNSQKLTNLADPTDPQDAATKAYVDAARSGLDVKASVRATTTANITLSGTQTVDGVALVAGDRVLVKNQNTASQNGIYVVAAGAWTRAADADTNLKVTSGMFTFVEEGTANADSGWVLSTPNPITLGTTTLAFNKFSGAGQLEAGAGLTKGGAQGNTIDVGTASTQRIVVNADNIDLATTGVVAAANYTRMTVDAYGRVTAADSPLVVAAGKVLTASNTLTFTGTDSSSVAFGTGGTVAYVANKLSVFAATTSAELAGVISDETGSGALVFANTPTLVTPNLGVATATSVNKVTITAPATSATLTIANGKTLTASNTLTFTGTDSSSVAFGAGGTVAYIGSNNAFTGANTFVNATGQTFRPAATQDGIVLLGRAGGTSTRAVTVTTAALTANRTVTLPDAAGTVVLDSTVCAAIADCALDGGTF